MNESGYPALAVLGPTASGKSRLAMHLALRLGGEVVSCDALQVYRGMDIGTAKSTAEERARVPHHMIDIRDPGEDFSAGDYVREGRAILRSVAQRRRLPIVAGGTGLYFRALLEGLFEGPGRSEPLRSRMRAIAARRGPATLHRALGRVDPDAAGRIAANDTSRILRAYEVWLISGKPMSWWQSQPGRRLSGFRWLKLGIRWPREALYERINTRVTAMFDSGLPAEAASLLSRYSHSCHAFKAIGYRESAELLAGTLSRDEAVERTQMESRRYAKRQLTWFRSVDGVRWLDAASGWHAVEEEAVEAVSEFLGGRDPHRSDG